MNPTIALAGFVAFTAAVHFGSIALAARRARAVACASATGHAATIIRPVCGLDNFDDATLRSTFLLEHKALEILFCVQSASDPVIPLVRRLIAEYPHIDARLLIGNHWISENPKLNNCAKGWREARHDWVALIDSNLLLSPDCIARLFGAWREDTGLVCSPPVGSHAEGLGAEIECAFLNTYQARWQYAADSIGMGFAQGKLMFWRKADLDRAGGIERLGLEPAEDAASTKVVRAAGLRVRLVDGPFAQPLGLRPIKSVWLRQVRWARLRRVTFPLFFTPEILCGGLFPTVAATALAHISNWPVAISMLGFLTAWYGAEWLLARHARWHMRAFTPLAWMARDLLLPALWIQAWTGRGFVWRGNAMTATRPGDLTGETKS